MDRILTKKERRIHSIQMSFEQYLMQEMSRDEVKKMIMFFTGFSKEEIDYYSIDYTDKQLKEILYMVMETKL